MIEPMTRDTERGTLLQVAIWAIQRELKARKQKTFVFCPRCSYEMCAMNNAIELKDGTVQHHCLNCGKDSMWNYDLPTPILYS